MFNLIPHTGNDWDEALKTTFHDRDMIVLFLTVESARNDPSKHIYPPAANVFDALKYTSLADTKVVILGQDPYITPGLAHGLAFSALPGYGIPKSLMNIYKELQRDLGCFIPNNGYLLPWAKQGVLLLNTIMTVDSTKSKSHAGLGWEKLTDKVIKLVSDKPEPCVFMIWGNDAKDKAKLIDKENNLVLTAVHPSPLNGNSFVGCGHFSKCNDFLEDFYGKGIDWQIPNI